MKTCSVLAILLAFAGGSGGEVNPGEVLSQENWESARGLLPPEILRFYETGGYRNPVIAWPAGLYRRDDDFEAATKGNVGKYRVDEQGTIVEAANGAPPAGPIEGLPFPVIDPGDTQAGVKVLWNHYYDYWRLGNYHNNTELTWLGARGMDRQVTQDVYFLYHEAQPRRYRPASNPNALSWQFLARTIAPTDVYGTASLGWRYRDAAKRDSLWAFVPALRRIRSVSPANRSDGFLGSDLSQDDGPFFDGKPEDFTWKLVGEREMLRFTDPLSADPMGRSEHVALPSGGWQENWPKLQQLGFEDEAWKGVPWAPIAAALAKRPQWVIEGIPKDRYYLYGKIELYIDKGTYHGAWNRKYDWKGNLMNSYQVLAYPRAAEVPGVKGEYLWASTMIYRCAFNVKAGRATCPVVRASPTWPNARRIPIDPGFFDYQTLIRVGK